MMKLSHDGVVTAIQHGVPDAKFAYNGDGSTLAPHETESGDEAYGLIWEGPGDAPTEAQVVAWATETKATATAIAANEATLRTRLEGNVAKLKTAADLVASGQATPVQQRNAIELALRSTAALARLVLNRLDATD